MLGGNLGGVQDKGNRLNQRPLTASEIAALPAGLVAAVPVAEVRLVDRHHPVSRLAQVFLGHALIVVRGKRIFWPDLPDDLSRDKAQLSILAHELVHVWQYCGGMTLLHYLLRDMVCNLGHYTYRLDPEKPFKNYAFEQQAAMMEDWMRLQMGRKIRFGQGPVDADALAAKVPFL
jgi:hypothetical protein